MSWLDSLFAREKPDQPAGLISVLRDRSAEHGDRDDAAMDLAEYDTAITALIEVAMSPDEDEDLVESCGESIAEIWQRTSGFDATIFDRLPNAARRMIKQ